MVFEIGILVNLLIFELNFNRGDFFKDMLLLFCVIYELWVYF